MLKTTAAAALLPAAEVSNTWAQVVPGPTVFIPGNNNPASWAINTQVAIYSAAYQRRFTNILPNPLGAAFAYAPEAGTGGTTGVMPRYVISAGQTTQDLLGIGLQTPVWGYKNFETAQVTYPGRTFKVTRNQPVNVIWKNNLSAANGQPLPHLLPVEPDAVPGARAQHRGAHCDPPPRWRHGL